MKKAKTPAAAKKRAGSAEDASAIVHSSIYLPKAAHRALREIALAEDCKVHDLVIEGIDRVLRHRGRPPVADVK